MKQSVMKQTLFLCVINGLALGFIVSISFAFYYFSLMDNHLLGMTKNILTKQAFSYKWVLIVFFILYIVTTICMRLLTVIFHMTNHLFTYLILASILTFILLYILPYVMTRENGLLLYHYSTWIHLFCLMIIYLIFMAETIRYHRLFSM